MVKKKLLKQKNQLNEYSHNSFIIENYFNHKLK